MRRKTRTKLAVTYSKPQVVASTIGFEQAQWNAHYYPEDCPEDWRFAYFMNDFRAVYLPADVWHGKPEAIQAMAEELDETFELVLEWPYPHQGDIDAILHQLSPLERNIANIVFKLQSDGDGDGDTALKQAISAVSKHYAVSLNSDNLTNKTLIALAKQHHTNVVWHPNCSLKPALTGDYQVICLPCQRLRGITDILKTLKKLPINNTRIGLYIEPAPQSAQRAMACRDLIELLKLA